MHNSTEAFARSLVDAENFYDLLNAFKTSDDDIYQPMKAPTARDMIKFSFVVLARRLVGVMEERRKNMTPISAFHKFLFQRH